MGQKIQAVKGMNDLLPVEQRDFKLTSAFWQAFEETVARWAKRYAYQQIRTPILEQTKLFVRSIGEETDVVGKEMYTFSDSNDSLSLSMRPEGTASCLRAVVEHNLLYNGPQKLWYMGPMFRRERPQKGRYRQFHQFGAEALGYEGPDIDAEIIAMCADLWRELGILEHLTLEINSLGNAEERAAHRAALVGYLTGFAEPEAVLVLDATAGKSVLFCRDKDIEREIWNGYRFGPEGAKETFGFDEAYSISEFDERLPDLLADRHTLHMGFGRDAAFDARVNVALNALRARFRTGVTAPTVLRDVQAVVHNMRLFKDDSEIALMREAGLVACQPRRANCPAGLSTQGCSHAPTARRPGRRRSA